MTLLALLVSADDSCSEILSQVLPTLGIAVERFSDVATAIDRLHQQRFDALIVDFDDPEAANLVLEEGLRLNSPNAPVSVALVQDAGRAREILSSGAHFILYKPLSEENARAGLRAVAALLNRERRRAQRIPVQAPVELALADQRNVEGILIDLSETGMEVLTAEPRAAGESLNFRFRVPNANFEIVASGQVAWANSNGETGVRFLSLDEEIRTHLRAWLQAAAANIASGADETVPHCRLTDLSLGGCYVESNSPFPERAMIDLCLRTGEMAVHTEGMVRVTHPGFGMGVEFPSRTAEQRAQVANLINFLRNAPETMLELNVTPRALIADLAQFERPAELGDDLDDPLLELLRRGSQLQQENFIAELRCQRSGASVAS